MQNALLTSFMESGLFGKFILITLAFLSIYAWAIVQNKFFLFRKLRKEDNLFLDEIESQRGNILNIELDEEVFTISPLFKIFCSSQEALKEIIMAKNRIDSEDIEALEIVIQKVISEQRLKMEASISLHREA